MVFPILISIGSSAKYSLTDIDLAEKNQEEEILNQSGCMQSSTLDTSLFP